MGTVTKAPFSTRDGSLLEYAPNGPDHSDRDIDWRDNEPWKDALQVTTIARGHSAARFVWESADGRKFPMFMIDMLATAQYGIGPTGLVSGEWIVVKRGANYGIALMDAKAKQGAEDNHGLKADPVEHGYRLSRTPAGRMIHIVEKDRYGWAPNVDYTVCMKRLLKITDPGKRAQVFCIRCVSGFNYWLEHKK